MSRKYYPLLSPPLLLFSPPLPPPQKIVLSSHLKATS